MTTNHAGLEARLRATQERSEERDRMKERAKELLALADSLVLGGNVDSLDKALVFATQASAFAILAAF